MTPGKPNPTDAVVRALVELAESMRVEGLARLTYQGNDYNREAVDTLSAVSVARDRFEKALEIYVEKLIRA